MYLFESTKVGKLGYDPNTNKVGKLCYDLNRFGFERPGATGVVYGSRTVLGDLIRKVIPIDGHRQIKLNQTKSR